MPANFEAGLFAAAVSVAAWLYLLCARGGFWRIRPSLAPILRPNAAPKKIAVVIPARNEAGAIGATVESLLGQDLGGSCKIFVVDDASTDGTAEQAIAAARRLQRGEALEIVKAPPLAAGWTGKMWAVSHGIQRARAETPDFFLLTDADICHEPDSIATMITIAEHGGYDLVSFMVKLSSATLPERLLIPAFVFFFFLLYPPVWIRNPKRRTAGAAGGCILIKPFILQQAGGIEAIRGEIIDDCSLARRVKDAGGHIWLGLSETTHSTRKYESVGEIEKMISRTAFRQLNHSAVLLVGTILGMLIVYVLPVALLFSGNRIYVALGAATWLLMSAAYLPVVRFYKQSPLWAAALPAAAVFYAAATVHSAVKYWTGRGGEWKGRAQDV